MLNQWQAAKHIKKDSAVGLRASQREWWEARSKKKKKNTSQGKVGRAVETGEGKLGKGQRGKMEEANRRGRWESQT